MVPGSLNSPDRASCLSIHESVNCGGNCTRCLHVIVRVPHLLYMPLYMHVDLILYAAPPVQVYGASWWMALYGSPTPKRHIAWSNAATVQCLDLGILRKFVRQKLSKGSCKSAKTYTNPNGKKSFAGTSLLKHTQQLDLSRLTLSR